MKKLIPIFVATMLLLTMVPAFAAETVPSIEQKGTPTLVSASDESIELVPLFEAEQTDELRQAYAAIQTVSLGENIVIRDLFNVVGNVESGTITIEKFSNKFTIPTTKQHEIYIFSVDNPKDFVSTEGWTCYFGVVWDGYFNLIERKYTSGLSSSEAFTSYTINDDNSITISAAGNFLRAGTTFSWKAF